MRREIKIAKQFIAIVDKEGFSFREPWDMQAYMADKYPTFAYEVGSGIQKTVVVFDNFNFVLKYYRGGDIAREREIYKRAKKAGLSRWFLRVYFFEVGGKQFGIQHKITTQRKYLEENNIPIYYDESCSSAHPENCDYHRYVFPYELEEFLSNHWISDLHGENWGFTKTGHIAILDYNQ